MKSYPACKELIEHVKYTEFYNTAIKNSRTFQGFLKAFPTVFKGYKLMKNTDLHFKIQLHKC